MYFKVKENCYYFVDHDVVCVILLVSKDYSSFKLLCKYGFKNNYITGMGGGGILTCSQERAFAKSTSGEVSPTSATAMTCSGEAS